MTLEELARIVTRRILACEDAHAAELISQLESASGMDIEHTGVGYFAHFRGIAGEMAIPDRASFSCGSVELRMPELRYGAGCVLFVSQGKLDFLEVYSYGERFPKGISTVEMDP